MTGEEQLSMFDEAPEDVTIGELDAAIEKVQVAKTDYEAKKKVSNEAHAELEKAKFEALSMLDRAGKSSYKVDGIGTVSIANKLKVKMPVGPEQKAVFFNWLKENEGVEAFNHYLTVNYNALNALYNMKFEESEAKDEFKIPGISDPESIKEIRFRKG